MKFRSIFFFAFSLILFWVLIFAVFIFKEEDWICESYLVEKIYDWDTVEAVWLGKVRLLWVDTPEIYNPKYGFLSHKFYGCPDFSKKQAEEKLLWKSILFCADKLSQDKWKYGRKLRYAMIDVDGKQTSFGYYLISNARASVYKYSNFEKKQDYLAKEREMINNFEGIRSKECLAQDLEQRLKYWTWECQIKWNLSSSVGKVYYFPSDKNRKQVKINKEWEKMFCDHKQAEQDGFQRIGDILKEKENWN